MIDNTDFKYSCSNCDAYYIGPEVTHCPNCNAGTYYFKLHPEPKEKEAQDNINPSYYNGRDVMDIINRYALSFCLGNVLTYLLRQKKKNGIEDLKKAKWYLEEEIRIIEEKLEGMIR